MDFLRLNVSVIAIWRDAGRVLTNWKIRERWWGVRCYECVYISGWHGLPSSRQLDSCYRSRCMYTRVDRVRCTRNSGALMGIVGGIQSSNINSYQGEKFAAYSRTDDSVRGHRPMYWVEVNPSCQACRGLCPRRSPAGPGTALIIPCTPRLGWGKHTKSMQNRSKVLSGDHWA